MLRQVIFGSMFVGLAEPTLTAISEYERSGSVHSDVRSVRARTRILIISLNTSSITHCITHSHLCTLDNSSVVCITDIVEYYEILNSRFALEHRYEHDPQSFILEQARIDPPVTSYSSLPVP